MLKTKILTLSVHEDNAFDGIEIALHPNLFAAKGEAKGNELIDAHGNQNLGGANDNAGSSSSKAPFVVDDTNKEVGKNVKNERYNANSSESNPGLEAGDLIEIQVWDKKAEDGMMTHNTMNKILPQHPALFSNPEQLQHPNSPTPNYSSSSPSPNTTLSISQSSPHSMKRQVHDQTVTSQWTMPESKKENSSQATSPASYRSQEKQRTHPNSPYGIEIADYAIKNSPKSYERSMLSKSPSSSRLSSGAAIHPMPASNDSEGKPGDETLSYELRVYFVMRVNQKSLAAIKETAYIQISLRRQVADLYNLSSFDKITVTKVPKSQESIVLQAASADFITLTIKDQFISRGEMFNVQNFLLGKWMYEGERIITPFGFRAHAREIRHGDKIVRSGIVTKNTKITFRSRSSRIIWLVQISTEMWDYASPYDNRKTSEISEGAMGSTFDENDTGGICEIYFDKFVHFMYRLFEKWKQLEVTHSLTIIFFSRTFLNSSRSSVSGRPQENSGVIANEKSAIMEDTDGRFYEDHYKMIIENETRTDWESLVYKVKKEFLQYPIEVGWNIPTLENARVPSTATQGNVLEAINVTLNLLQLHFMDRDLYRTGNSIVLVSPGQGVFEVNRGLAGITKQRMMDNGIGSDMVSLGGPTMHIAPLFLYKERKRAAFLNSQEMGGATIEDSFVFDDWRTYFEIPHWMNLSFISYDREGEKPPVPLQQDTETGGKVSIGANSFSIPKNIDEGWLRSTSLGSNTSLASYGDGQQSTKSRRNLISGRDFDDILDACRPRKRGDSMARMPSALLAIIQRSTASTGDIGSSMMHHMGLDTNSESPSLSSSSITSTKDRTHRNLSREVGASYFKSHPVYYENTDVDFVETTAKISSSDAFNLKEWRRVHFDDFLEEKSFPILMPSLHTLTERNSGSQKSSDRGESLSASSSFNSSYSHSLAKSLFEQKRSRSPSLNTVLSYLQIQPSASIDTKCHLQTMIREDVNDDSASGNRLSEESLHALLDEDERNAKVNVNANKEHKQIISFEGREITTKKASESKYTALDELKARMKKYDSDIFSQNSTGQVSSQTSGSHSISVSKLYGNGTDNMRRISQDSLDISLHSRKGLDNSTSSTNVKKGGIAAALVQFNQSNNSSGPNNNSGIRRIRSAKRFQAGLGQYTTSMASYGSGGSSGYYAGFSTSLGKSGVGLSPPLKPLAGSLNPNSPDPFHLMPGQLTLLIPPGGTTTELGKINNTGWGNHLVTGKALSYENKPRMPAKGGIFTNSVGDQVDNEVWKSKSVYDNQVKQSHIALNPHNSNQNQTKKLHQQHSKKSKSKTKKKQPKHNQIPFQGKPVNHSRHKPWVLNPFRQQDEEEILAKRTHNRRRWSHVFPLGEVEFKRHAGPNWKSLCQPAVLPLTIDYHPSQQDLSDPDLYGKKHYEVRLDAIDDSHYKDYREYLIELVTQRLIQDFQVVPQDVVKQRKPGYSEVKSQKKQGSVINKVSKTKNSFFHTQAANAPNQKAENTHTLSMGHSIHQISYNPSRGAIEVIQYSAIFAQNDSGNVQDYNYNIWVPSIKSYSPVMQRFKKYSNVIYWNLLDNLISGDLEKRLTEETRFRRLIFVIIPDQFGVDTTKEQEYVQKFHRLLEFILKQQQKDSWEKEIDIITSTNPADGKRNNLDKSDASSEFVRCTIPLVKSKIEKYEWMDILLESRFDTRRSFHIQINWLVANGSKIEAHLQLLCRRCSQYGLNLVSVPSFAMSSTIVLNPLVCPPMFPVRSKEDSAKICSALIEKFHFVFDGKYWLDTKEFESMKDFVFTSEKKWIRRTNAMQYIHNSGLLFIRAPYDNKGWTIFIIFINRRVAKDDAQLEKAHLVFHSIKNLIREVNESRSYCHC